LRIGLLNNLRAGRSSDKVHRLLGLLKSHPEVAHVETDRAGAVPEALSDLSRREVDILVVNGGDGTLQHALTEILGNGEFRDRIPMVAPLRGGRTNMTALDLGVQRDPVKAMAELIAAAKAGTIENRVVERRVLRVEYGPFRELLYGMFFGAGVIHRAIDLVHRVMPPGRGQGVLGASVVTASLLGRFVMLRDSSGVLTPNKAQVMLDGELIADGEFTLMISSTLRRLFARMRPFWGTGAGAVRFTGVAANAKQLWRAAPPIVIGRPSSVATERNGYTSRNVKRAELRFDCGFTVDGELVAPEAGRYVSVSAEDTVRFLRV
jgi:hypothetical protein